MNSRWRLLAVSVLLTATILLLVHWHHDVEGQRCELCRVQQIPSLHSPVQNPLAAPIAQERYTVLVEIVGEPDPFLARAFGRAPPIPFFA